MHGFKTIEEFTLEECEAFLKRNDISGEDRQRVEERMKWLLDHPSETPRQPEPPQPEPPERPKTIAEQFPEYRFVLTSTLEEEKHGVLLNILLFLIAGYALSVLVYWGVTGFLESVVCIVSGFFVFAFGVAVREVGIKPYVEKFSPIKTVADYISENSTGRRGKRTIFVKSRKFGVLHSKFHRVVIGAQYDQLSWLNDDVLLG